MNIIKRWGMILEKGNLPKGEPMDAVSKWLLCTRAEVFSMTITSVLVGAVIAGTDGYFNWLNTLIITAALILAHAANNLINDYWDYKNGLDTPDYDRVKYAPHPIVSGLLTEKQLLGAFFVMGVFELAAALYLYTQAGLPVLVFAAAGFLTSIFYVAPPVKLKYRGAGEFAIFLIWGPLITVGTYYVLAGAMPLHAWLLSVPYGLVVMNVLLGKHLDKYEMDKKKGVKTFTVLLGWEKAVLFTKINTAMFYIWIVGLVFFQLATPFALLAFLSAKRFKVFIDVLSSKKPETPPEGFPPLWPLWYVVWAFWFNKMAGGLFILGLVLGLIFGI
ncbi:MAG: prenyltransferase [Candidatus Goldiibacteriota bacterium]